MPGAGGAGSGRPSAAAGLLQRRDGVFQQLGAGKLDTQATAGKKFDCLFSACLDSCRLETPL